MTDRCEYTNELLVCKKAEDLIFNVCHPEMFNTYMNI